MCDSLIKQLYRRQESIYENQLGGAGVAQRLCNGLPRDDPGFDSPWEQCKNRTACPSQRTVNGCTVSK